MPLLVSFSTAVQGFEHGVASGGRSSGLQGYSLDESHSAGIPEKIRVRVEVASDEKFGSLVYSSVESAMAKRDCTVKIDVKGLSSGTVYHCSFRSDETESVIDRIRTLPRGDVDSVRLAVFSRGLLPSDLKYLA